jgi:hypothetical protein
MSDEQKMEFLYNWCFQMSEVVLSVLGRHSNRKPGGLVAYRAVDG